MMLALLLSGKQTDGYAQTMCAKARPGDRPSWLHGVSARRCNNKQQTTSDNHANDTNNKMIIVTIMIIA